MSINVQSKNPPKVCSYCCKHYRKYKGFFPNTLLSEKRTNKLTLLGTYFVKTLFITREISPMFFLFRPCEHKTIEPLLVFLFPNNYSINTTAIALIPSPLPSNPSFSVVVALTLTLSTEIPIASATFSLIFSIYPLILGL